MYNDKNHNTYVSGVVGGLAVIVAKIYLVYCGVFALDTYMYTLRTFISLRPLCLSGVRLPESWRQMLQVNGNLVLSGILLK